MASSALVALILASSVRPVNFGTTTAARTARMTSTSRSSMWVKARRVNAWRWLMRFIERPRGLGEPEITNSKSQITNKSQISNLKNSVRLLDQVLEVEDGEEHADDDGSDEAGHEKEHQGLGQRDKHAEVAVEVGLVGDGEADQLLAEAAGLLGDGDHLDDGCGEEDVVTGEALGERLPALHLVDRVGDAVCQRLVAQCFPGDAKGGDQR